MRTRNENKTISQLDKANALLKDMTVNITTQDKKEAIKELNYTEMTVRRYMKGRGTDLDTAFKMIKFFQKRIEEREKTLQGAALN